MPTLRESNPALVTEWHPELNGLLTPNDFSAGSNKQVWWLGKCGHEWKARIYSRNIGRGCPYCAGNRVLVGFNDFATRKPEIAVSWDYERNGDLRPDQFTAGSKVKVWWRCPEGHSWHSSIEKRSAGRGCGVCRNLIFIPGVNDLATLRPDIAAQWDAEKNGDLTPEKLGPGSEVKVWWRCSLGHSFDSNVDSRCRDGKGCRICAGRELLENFNDLATRYPEIAKEFHPVKNGDLTPNRILAGQPRDYWWLGKCGHEWKARLTNRVALGAGCPECSAGGYSSTKPGTLYFIRQADLGAFKVGITNRQSKNNRLENFEKAGWKILETWDSDNGRVILETEFLFFKWLRGEKGIPNYLGKSEMGTMNGSTETFSDSILTETEVISTIEEMLKRESLS